MSCKSLTVNALAECARMFRRPMPKYTLSAPALSAAARLSRLPTGAMISMSSLFIIQTFTLQR